MLMTFSSKLNNGKVIYNYSKYFFESNTFEEMCQCVCACLCDCVCVVLHRGVENTYKKLIRVFQVRMGTGPGPFDHMHHIISYIPCHILTYHILRDLCSSHLQCPTHCAPRTPCAEEEGKEGVNGGWVRRREGG